MTFREFVETKTREAERAVIDPLRTLEDCSHGRPMRAIANAWTRRLYDGDFYVAEPPPDLPAMSLVFVQSREGNTGARNPDDLGGGPTDKILIYEGLSRVAADAVLAGASTAAGRGVFFSVWHPQLVSLRRELGLPRHPAQIVVSKDGRVNLDARLFNVPGVPVFLIAGDQCRERCASLGAERPWVKIVPIATLGLRATFAALRAVDGISRISVVGGRTIASALLDAGLIQELFLTTTSLSAGEANTPLYTGRHQPAFDLMLKKQTRGHMPILFEHLTVASDRT
jgi:riboflavin biosynthesis pyrimidine reductase